MLLPNQRREVTIDYQPILLTANPKGDSFRIERISSSDSKSGKITQSYRHALYCLSCSIGGWRILRLEKKQKITGSDSI